MLRYACSVLLSMASYGILKVAEPSTYSESRRPCWRGISCSRVTVTYE
jgi:hypothetical protein